MFAFRQEIAVFGGGCFWCTEAIFLRLRGVIFVLPGYAGGAVPNPTYEQVSSGRTGHVEVVKFEFNPSIIIFKDLLNVFFALHDPTSMNRQGADAGEQYKSVIFYANDDQRREAEEYISNLEKENIFDAPIVTELRPLDKFYIAEDYHKNYYEKNKDNNPYCQVVINPKLAKLRQKFSPLLKPE
ncbi:MAG: peptide-methionine (S)-S-oxide reductase MsrA [Candidatus Doudnabacteria bacterium]|nr:peptide-methionine (S)-S-oxide reductase MsrA [Candidatus Doudnabacteria bacterium]